MNKIYHKALGYINATQKNIELVNIQNGNPSKKRTKASNINAKRAVKPIDGEELVDTISE